MTRDRDPIGRPRQARPQAGPSPTDALAALRRWEEAGGTWTLRAGGAGSTVVDLITCDGGAVMGELVSSDPDFVAHVLAGAKERLDP